MKDLVIKHNDKTIFRGYDHFGVDTSLPVLEFHQELMVVCQDELGMNFDQYLNEFGAPEGFENLVENGDVDDIIITLEDHSPLSVAKYLYG